MQSAEPRLATRHDLLRRHSSPYQEAPHIFRDSDEPTCGFVPRGRVGLPEPLEEVLRRCRRFRSLLRCPMKIFLELRHSFSPS
jgi:hypothetical protein